MWELDLRLRDSPTPEQPAQPEQPEQPAQPAQPAPESPPDSPARIIEDPDAAMRAHVAALIAVQDVQQDAHVGLNAFKPAPPAPPPPPPAPPPPTPAFKPAHTHAWSDPGPSGAPGQRARPVAGPDPSWREDEHRGLFREIGGVDGWNSVYRDGTHDAPSGWK